MATAETSATPEATTTPRTSPNQKHAAQQLGISMDQFKELKQLDGFPGNGRPPYDLDRISEFIKLHAAPSPETIAAGGPVQDTEDLQRMAQEPLVQPILNALHERGQISDAAMIVLANIRLDKTFEEICQESGVDFEKQLENEEARAALSESGIILTLPLHATGKPAPFAVISKRLTSPLSQRGFDLLYHGLRESHARLESGEHVDKNGHVVEFICEQVALAHEGKQSE